MLGRVRIRDITIILGLAAGLGYAGTGMAEDTKNSQSTTDDVKQVKTKKWKCKYCPYGDEPKFNGKVEFGLGYVSNDSFKFGDYTGLNEKGLYFIGNADGSYKDEKANYLDFDVADFGLDSRIIEIEGGKQGVYDLELEYNQIPKFTSDTTRSPYSGEENQTLPSGWVSAPNTSGFDSLANDLQNRDIYTMRRDFSIGATLHQTKSLSYDLRFQRSTKKGHKTMGLALGNNFGNAKSVILAEPVDYITDAAHLAVNYNGNKWRGQIAYEGSLFRNDSQALRWQNAYSEPVNVSEGQAALAPDNGMHQLFVSGAYDILKNLTATALLSVGRMFQDESFLPYSVNNSVSPPPLPRNSLDGQVNTFVGYFDLISQLTSNFLLKFRYSQDEQDNVTDRSTYDYVVLDTTVASTSHANFPYSFRKRNAEIMGRYKFPARSVLSFGHNYEVYDRTYQEVNTTKENKLWLKFRSRPHRMVDIVLAVDSSRRNGDAYTPVAEIQPPENPLLRKFNMADRDRNNVGLAVNITPLDSLFLGLAYDYSKADYTDSDVGLTDSDDSIFTFDANYMVTTLIGLNGFYSVQWINSNQVGSQGTSLWYGENEDKVDTAGLGLDYQIIEDTLKIGFDFIHAQSNGKVNIVSATPFPDLTTKRDTFELYTDYQPNDDWLLKFVYRYEKYDESNWAVDGVVPNTLDNVLTMGEVSPNYNVGVFAVSAQYQF